jgi:hypothetical protein
MPFDPKRHVIKVQGNREYLPVSARLIWFRMDHPDWGIVTEPVEINLEKQYAIFMARIYNAEGKVMATATKMENVRGFGDYIEKAETGSVGRALALCGYGTQFAPELEEGGRMADSPYPMGGNRFASRPAGPTNRPEPARQERQEAASYPERGNGNGNGGARPLSPRPTAPPPPREPMPEDDEPFADEEPAPRAAAPVARGEAPAPARPAPAGRPAPPGAQITRVREPEPTTFDPGEDDDEESDPFAEEEPVPAPKTAARPSASAAADGQVSNHCSVEGCSAVLNPAQLTMSINKFGKPLCPTHQREATPVAAGAGASSGGGRRKASAGTESLL